MSFVFVSLRGTQMARMLEKKCIQLNNFADFPKAFLESYFLAWTAHTAPINLHDVKQQPMKTFISNIVFAYTYFEYPTTLV
jgi:hypothetical protein